MWVNWFAFYQTFLYECLSKNREPSSHGCFHPFSGDGEDFFLGKRHLTRVSPSLLAQSQYADLYIFNLTSLNLSMSILYLFNLTSLNLSILILYLFNLTSLNLSMLFHYHSHALLEWRLRRRETLFQISSLLLIRGLVAPPKTLTIWIVGIYV